MNQPTAEDLREIIGIDDAPYQAVLDRYILIDKTEPIPGAVKYESVENLWIKVNERNTRLMLKSYDVFPKGTVARLEAYNTKLKRLLGKYQEEKTTEARQTTHGGDELKMIDLCDSLFGDNKTPMTDLEKELADALDGALDDVREVLFENESKWGAYRKDRIEMKKAQIEKIESLLKRARGE